MQKLCVPERDEQKARGSESILQYVENGDLSYDDIHASAERIRVLKKKIEQQ